MPTTYSLIPLGFLPGGTVEQGLPAAGSVATGINASGQVVGYCRATSASGQNRGFLYSNGTMTDIGSLVSGGTSQAFDINDSGTIVGTAQATSSFPQYSQAFIYTSGVFANLGSLYPNSASSATGINNSGEVVGTSQAPSFYNPPAPPSVPFPFFYPNPNNGLIWNTGVQSNAQGSGDADEPAYGFATRIGENHKICGAGTQAQSPFAFLISFTYGDGMPILDTEVITDLGAFPGDDEYAHTPESSTQSNDVNIHGAVVGYGTAVDYNGTYHTFIDQPPYSKVLTPQGYDWGTGDWLDIGIPLPSNTTFANAANYPVNSWNIYGTAINDSGIAVGYMSLDTTLPNHAFIYQNGTIYDLNLFINPSSGWVLVEATDINNNGQICGYGFNSANPLYYGQNITKEAFLLTPQTSGSIISKTNPDANISVWNFGIA